MLHHVDASATATHIFELGHVQPSAGSNRPATSSNTVSVAVAPDARIDEQKESKVSVYRVTEVIGTSTESWEAAARSAVETAAATVRELRVAEVVRQDVTIENGNITSFRVRLAISFKYESES